MRHLRPGQSLDGDLSEDVSAAIRPMTDRLYHRGPDGGGYFHAPWLALGHRRLAIIDRAGGDQPMANEDRSVWIVFNGEVYNHRELRRDLEARGHSFRTQSDTEAIVHAYEEYGDACVDRLDGMFAFAIADLRGAPRAAGARSARQEAAVSRHLQRRAAFRQRDQGDQGEPAVERRARSRLDRRLPVARLFRRAGHRVSPRPQARARAHAVGRTARASASASTGTSARSTPIARAGRALIDEVDARLAAAVSRRLESEVPIGAFLSGGIDSGLVVSYMAEALGTAPVTASVGFDHAGHNELEPAGVTASAFLHASPHGHRASRNLDEVLDPIVASFDEPFADPSAIPTYYVSKMARQHVTVALSGDGGDEAFGGYAWRYVPHALEEKARAFMPGSAARNAAAWLGARWPRSRAFPRPLRLGNVLENLGRDPAGAYYADLCFLKPQDARALLGKAPTRDPADSPVYDQVTRPYRECPSDSAVQRAQYADLKIYLPNDPLVKVDRMSMANSLEIRCPLLDHRLVELAFQIPTAQQDAERPSRSRCCASLAGAPPAASSRHAAEARVHGADRQLARRAVRRSIPRRRARRRRRDRATSSTPRAWRGCSTSIAPDAPTTPSRCGRCGCSNAGRATNPRDRTVAAA